MAVLYYIFDKKVSVKIALECSKLATGSIVVIIPLLFIKDLRHVQNGRELGSGLNKLLGDIPQ